MGPAILAGFVAGFVAAAVVGVVVALLRAGPGRRRPAGAEPCGVRRPDEFEPRSGRLTSCNDRVRELTSRLRASNADVEWTTGAVARAAGAARPPASTPPPGSPGPTLDA